MLQRDVGVPVERLGLLDELGHGLRPRWLHRRPEVHVTVSIKSLELKDIYWWFGGERWSEMSSNRGLGQTMVDLGQMTLPGSVTLATDVLNRHRSAFSDS